MKKLISVVLVLAMLASMMVYLPLGASAEESAATETIYSEDFTGKDGTYTLAELATKMGWTLLRGDAAATATIANGVLTINPGTAKDVVFEIVKDARLKSNHTYSYDMTKFYKGADLCFAGIYTGTDNGETVTAIVPKTTYENYNHIALASNTKVNEGNQRVFPVNGGGYEQTRPESIPGGGTTNTWKVVYDVTNNQVDYYASGARVNSTAGAAYWANYNVADYAGEGAYLRVQKAAGASSFDNISIVTGGEAIIKTSNVVYSQNFDDVTYDPATETLRQLADKIGFQTLNATAKNDTNTSNMEYSITNGRLEILANPDNGKKSGANRNQMGVFGTLYIPEMETSKENVVIEYDMTYLYDSNRAGSLNDGDSPFTMEVYGRRDDFNAWWGFTQKGFANYGFRNGKYKNSENKTLYINNYGNDSTSSNTHPLTSGRYEHIAFNAKYGSNIYTFSNGAYHHSLIGSTEHIKVVLDYDNGMFVYVNGVIAIQLTPTMLEGWLSTKGTATAKHEDIIGNLMRFAMTAGCHVALDNLTVSVDVPITKEAPAIILTEQSCGTTGTGWCTSGGSEYVEIYNNSTKPVNIYDYAFTQRQYSGGNNAANSSFDLLGKEIGFDNIHLAYPGTHTFKSIKTDAEGNPLYTYDVTNPSYEDGWLQPGEVAMLWNKSDAMHNGAYSNPTVVAATGKGNNGAMDEAAFRASLNLDASVKVFAMYNDYNRAFNNSGYHVVGLVDRALVQPGYDPATGTGDETLTNAKVGLAEYKSSLINVCGGTDSSTSMKTVAYATYGYAWNNAFGYGDVMMARPLAANTASAMTAGYLLDTQKRAFTVTVNGAKKTAYLGEAIKPIDYVTLEGFQQALFVKVDGVVVDASKPITVLADITIEVGDIVALSTAPGASLRINYDESGDVIFGMRWLTAINTADLEALIAKYGKENVEIGTLIARTEELTDAEQALAIENLFDEDTAYDKVVRKAVAYAGEWYPATSDYEGFAIFAGGVGKMQLDYNAMKEYVAVGYVSVTIDGETYTLYGAADTTAQTKVIYDMMGEALGDYEENDAAGTPENSILTAEEYELVNEAYWNI